ncbi:MAG: hypothetical protein ACT6UH_00645 [Hydrogenophaga sp.]|uniref:hypothetical protein n=1 Tax=Hydrogenophaga sp. TaxID=1904254 RepID=UPI004036C1B8
MAIRINADLQAIYIYEPAGHTVPAMNGPWTILGEVVVHSDVDLPSIIVTRYLDASPSGWAGTYYGSDGSTHYIYDNPGTGQVASSPWTMGPGRYSYSLHYNGANLIQVRIDGVLVVEFAASVPAGTPGARSVQWGGFGTPALAGYMDSTWQRWRMWSADLTPLECFAEFRSPTPVRTSGLIHNWPMDAGSARFDDTVAGEPDLLDNPAVPCGDGADIPLQVGQRVYFGAAGTSASGTASCAPAYPSGISSSTSDLWCEVTGRSNDAGTAFGVPAGWTLVADSMLEGGVGTWAADTGTRRVALYKKDTVSGTETGTISVTLGGAVTTNNTLRATIFRTERPGGTTLQVAATTGADTTNGTGFSATGSTSLAFDVGDLVMVGVAQNIDTGTQSAVSLTAAGIEFAPRLNVRSDAVTNGNDHRHIIDAFHVMSGTATVAPTYAYTISASGSGPTSFVRMRAVFGGEASLAGAAAAQATASAALSVAKGLNASGASQASASAVLLKSVQLVAAGIASATGGASLSHGVPLQASAAAVAAAGADLALVVQLSASGLAAALASAGMSVGKPLGAAGAAQAAGSADLQVTSGAELSAAGTAQASATAILSLSVWLGAEALAQAQASAALAISKPLSAAGVAQAAGTANLQVTAGNDLTAHGAAQVSATAALQLEKRLAAAGVAQALASAGLLVANRIDLQAGSEAQAVASASLQLTVPLTAQAIAQALATGSLLLTVPLSADALAQSSATAQFQPTVQMSAQGIAMASATALLKVSGAYARAPAGPGYYVSAPSSSRPACLQSGSRINTRKP